MLMNNLDLVGTYENGSIYKNSSSNPPYTVYIPKGVNPSTKVHAYMHGAANNTSDVNISVSPIVNYLSNSDTDSVVILYTGISTVYKEDKARMLLDVTYDCINNVGANPKDVTFEGFSDGGVSALCLTAEHLKRNPNLPPQLVVSYDASALDYNVAKNMTAGLSESDIEAYRRNGTTILTFERGNSHYDSSDKPIKNLVSKGIDVVTVSTGQNHQGVNRQTHYDGIYDVLDGKSLTLRNSSNYTFERWVIDPNGSSYNDGKWVRLTQEEVYSLFSKNMSSMIKGRYGYLTSLNNLPMVAENVSLSGDSVASDMNYVINEVNMGRKAISSTSFLNGIDSVEFLSSTKMPAEINNYIGDVFVITGSLLEKCNLAMESLTKIGQIFEEIDNTVSEEANQLGDSFVSSPTGGSNIVGESDNVKQTDSASQIEVDDNIITSNSEDVISKDEHKKEKNDTLFDNISASNNQTVYEIDNNTKLVINNNGESFCYYKITDIDNINDIINRFRDNEMVSQVVNDNGYLKIVFNKSKFNRDKFNELIESFKIYSI